MTVSVDIEIARRPQALVIGLDAVHEPDGPAPWVLKLQDGRARQQTVHLGLKAAGVAEVLDGLQAGDTLVTGADAVHDGQRVRARATPAR
jgi:HlyD family secretion protein